MINDFSAHRAIAVPWRILEGQRGQARLTARYVLKGNLAAVCVDTLEAAHHRIRILQAGLALKVAGKI